MAKQKFRITNWRSHNKALILRGTITFWRDGEAIQAWYESAPPSSRGRTQRYSDLAITTALVIKRVFRLTDPAGLNCPPKVGQLFVRRLAVPESGILPGSGHLTLS